MRGNPGGDDSVDAPADPVPSVARFNDCGNGVKLKENGLRLVLGDIAGIEFLGAALFSFSVHTKSSRESSRRKRKNPVTITMLLRLVTPSFCQ